MERVEKPLTSEVLARTMGTNSAVFRRTMAGLRKAGYVRSGKGHGDGWQLTKTLDQITLLAIYQALDRPTLFAIGSRNGHPDCSIEADVKATLSDTMLRAESLLFERFAQITFG